DDGDEDMDVDGSDGDMGDDDDDDDYDENFDDDEDLSWKVRKAAARVLGAAIRAYPHLLTQFYGSFGKTLVTRFAEDEENVRMEVLSTFLVLLHQTAALGIATNAGAGAGSEHL